MRARVATAAARRWERSVRFAKEIEHLSEKEQKQYEPLLCSMERLIGCVVPMRVSRPPRAGPPLARLSPLALGQLSSLVPGLSLWASPPSGCGSAFPFSRRLSPLAVGRRLPPLAAGRRLPPLAAGRWLPPLALGIPQCRSGESLYRPTGPSK